MLLSTQQLKEAEKKAFSNGVSPEALMEKAGRQCVAEIQRFFSKPSKVLLFCGKGNNAGDALVIGRELRKRGWRVEAEYVCSASEMSDLGQKKRKEFEATEQAADEMQKGPLLLVDGLLGIGATGPLRGAFLEAVQRINKLRQADHAFCFSIDIPTGLNADTGEVVSESVCADWTLSIARPKKGFLKDSAQQYLGRLVEISLSQLEMYFPTPVQGADSGEEADCRFIFPSNLKERLPARRSFEFHKVNAGRVLIIAGSKGFTGAARLAAEGALKSGAGLVTLCVPSSVYEIVASAAPAEVMVRPFDKLEECVSVSHDVLGVGPGMGREFDAQIVELILKHEKPMVVDADALNALALTNADLSKLPKNRLLTPHPGEFARLADYRGERCDVAKKAVQDWGVSLLLKGSRSVVASVDEKSSKLRLELNTTGHPGMASGGMGDVLTGLCSGLIAQGVSLHDSACLGSWLLGRSAEIVWESSASSQESVVASNVADALGRAVAELYGHC